MLLTILCLLFATLSYWARGHAYVYWGAAGTVLLLISILMPRVLAPLKRLWLGLGALLHVLVSPLVVGLTYLLAIVPIGLLTRAARKDLLSLRRDSAASTYWIDRPLGEPAPESLRDQF